MSVKMNISKQNFPLKHSEGIFFLVIVHSVYFPLDTYYVIFVLYNNFRSICHNDRLRTRVTHLVPPTVHQSSLISGSSLVRKEKLL